MQPNVKQELIRGLLDSVCRGSVNLGCPAAAGRSTAVEFSDNGVPGTPAEEILETPSFSGLAGVDGLEPMPKGQQAVILLSKVLCGFWRCPAFMLGLHYEIGRD